MSKETDKRKLEHINIVNSNGVVDLNCQHFNDIKLIHRALPEINYQQVNSSCTFLEKTLSFPLLISSMTGGSDKTIKAINKNLAIAAEHCGVALGVGSQRVLFEESKAEDSFKLRQFAPSTLLFANLGAIQLNYGFGLKECQNAVDLLEADALILHLNPLQEVIQQSGNTNFSNLIEKIAAVRDHLSVPIILKEVGSGFSLPDAEVALKHGFNIIDIAGQGGTSWSLVEHLRQEDNASNNSNPIGNLGLTFQDWGIPTPVSLQLLRAYSNKLTLLASGGIRTGVDMVKANILGACLCGVANPFLKPALNSTEAVIENIMRLKREYTTTMFLLGCEQYSDVYSNRELILA